MKARKYILIGFFLIVIPLLISYEPSFQYSGGGTLGFGREVIEFAKGTNYDQNVIIPGSPSVFVDIPTDWTGNQMLFDVYELTDIMDWIINGTFDSGTTYSSPPWNYQEINDTTELDDGQWVAANQCIYAELPMRDDASARTYSENECSYWNETVPIDRGTIIAAELRLSYYPNDVYDRSEIEAFVRIEGEYVWRLDFRTISLSGQEEQWNNLTSYVNPSIFNLSADQDIQIEIGVRYTSGRATYTNWDDQNRVYFDNISLILRSTVKPSQVDLRVETPDFLNYTISTVDYGTGNVTFLGTWGPAAPPLFEQFYFTFLTNTSLPVEVNLKTVATVSATCNTTSNPAIFSVGNQSDVSWTLSHRTEMSVYDEPRGEGPTKYVDYYFNLSTPLDWNLNNILDPNGIGHQPGDQNYTLTILGNKKVLTVNATAIGLYGLYTCQADSKNYASDIQLQVLTNGTWVNSSTFADGDSIRVIAGLLDENGLPPVDLGNATITITDPTDSMWPSSVNMVVNASGVAISDVIIVSNSSLTGPYTINVDWTNGYEAGTVQSKEFGKRGLININLVRPTQEEANVEAGTGFWLSFNLIDPITGENVSIAGVQYRADWMGAWEYMPPKLEDQPYSVLIEVPGNLTGQHTVIINVTDNFYGVEQEISVTISVWQPWYIFGIPGWTFITIIPIIALAGALLYVVLNPYVRFPSIVRKIMKMKKDIRRGKVPKPFEVRARDDLLQSVFDQETSLVDAIAIPGLPIVEPSPEEIEIPSEGIPESEVEVPPETEIEENSIRNINQKTEQVEETKRSTEENKQILETGKLEIDQELDAFRNEINGIEGLSDSDKEMILEELRARPPGERRKTLDLIKKEAKNYL
ncbi:MAG: hypothetical protein ACFE7I_05875 [Candidatus Hodarchaeota archaeon]